MHRSEGATALLGMEEFVVGAQDEVDGEVWLLVETTAEVVGCDACGTRAVGHGRRVVRVRDLAAGDRPVVLVWRKRIWRCPDPDCGVKTWSEETDGIAPRAVLTERAREETCRRVGAEGQSVAQVARSFGVGWHTAMAAVRDHGRPRVDHLSRLRRPTAIGLDETSFLAANPAHPTLLVSGFVDLDRHRLIDVVPGRSAEAVSTWLAAKPPRWLAGIRTAVIDPYSGYARGLAEGLPNARLVVDHFHAVRLANQALDEVRRRVQRGRSATGATSPTPSTALGAASSPPTNGSASTPGRASSCCSASAIPRARWERPTSPRSCCVRCSTRRTDKRPAGGSAASTRSATRAKCPSSSASPAPSAAGSTRSSPGTRRS